MNRVAHYFWVTFLRNCVRVQCFYDNVMRCVHIPTDIFKILTLKCVSFSMEPSRFVYR